MKVTKKGIMKVTHFEENRRERNKYTKLLRTAFLFCLLALILRGSPFAEHKLWQIKRRNNSSSPSLFKAFRRGAVPKTNISCKFFTHRKLYQRALRSLLITLKSEFTKKRNKQETSQWHHFPMSLSFLMLLYFPVISSPNVKYQDSK